MSRRPAASHRVHERAGFEQPAVRDRHARDEGCVRRHRLEHRLRDTCVARREGVGPDRDDRLRQRIDGCLPAGRVRMAAGDFDLELQRQIALLGDADERHGPLRDRSVAQRQPAFIEHERRRISRLASNSAAARAPAPPDSSSCPNTKITLRAGRVARGDQRLRRFQHGNERALVVERAASPDVTLGDRAGERRMRQRSGCGTGTTS